MAFNFMSFLGGAAGAGSEYIDTKNEAAAAEKLTKEQRQWQIATEGRADARARKLRREERSRQTEEYVGSMVALGMPLEVAQEQAKLGVGAINVAIEDLKYGRENGVDTSGFYTLKQKGNVPITGTEISEISRTPSLVIDSDAIKNMYGALESDVGTHNEALLKITNQQLALDLSTDKGKDAFDALEERKSGFLKDMSLIAGAKDTTGGRLFGESTVKANIDSARSRALATYEMTLDIEGNIKGKLEGRGVEANVANLDAAKFLRGSLEKIELQDPFMNSSIDMLESQAISGIIKLGYDKIRTKPTEITTVSVVSPETDRSLATGSIIRVPINDTNGQPTGQYTYSIYTGTKDANNYIPLYTGS